MNIRGTATGPAHGSALVGAAAVVFTVLLLIAAVIYGFVEMKNERDDCHSMGGFYVESRGTNMCIQDGLVIKVYP